MKDNMSEKEKKLYKFLIIILKISLSVLLLLLISVVVIGITKSEKRDREIAKIQQEQNKQLDKTEQTSQTQTTQQPDSTTKADSTSEMTESENAYWETATPYVLEILNNNKSIIEILNSKEKESNWQDTVDSLAQKIIENGDYLENLQYTDDTKTIGTLVQLFGYNISHAYENYMEGVANSDPEKIEFYQMDYKTAMCQFNEINFYSTYGVEILKQLENDIKNIVGEHTFNSIQLSSGANYLFVRLNKELFENKKVLRDDCLLSVNDTLEMLSKNSYYNYLDLEIKIDCDVVDSYGQKKELVVMDVRLNSDTRSKINFENFSWINIPDIADSYRYFFENNM